MVGEWPTKVSAHTDLSLIPTSSSFKYTCMSWALLPSPALGVHKDLFLEAWGPLALGRWDASCGIPNGFSGRRGIFSDGRGLQAEEQGISGGLTSHGLALICVKDPGQLSGELYRREAESWQPFLTSEEPLKTFV